MHQRLAPFYKKINQYCIDKPKVKGPAKTLLCQLAKKPDGFKISLAQAKNSPAHSVLMDLKYAFHDGKNFKASPIVLERAS